MSKNCKNKNGIFEKILSLPIWFWIIFGSVSVAASLVRKLFLDGECLMKDIFGIPCPACGMTRAFYSLMMLDIRSAFYFNPAFWTVPLMVVCGAMAALTKKRRTVWLVGVLVLTAIVIAVWIIRLFTGSTV